MIRRTSRKVNMPREKSEESHYGVKPPKLTETYGLASSDAEARRSRAQIAAQLSGPRLAPPTSRPSTSGAASSAAAFAAVTLPP